MLLDLQRAFRATVTGSANIAAPLVQTPRGTLARRLAVYRNTVQKSLVDVLAIAFPVVQRVVGEQFFFALARDFATQHPPQVPQLSIYGADFPSFIAAHAQTKALPYLADVARLEWARGEAYFAADVAPFNPLDLAALAPEQLPDAKLRVHPATRLITSVYPIYRIWSVNQPEVTDIPVVDMTSAESVLITRPQYQVFVRGISKADAAFVTACVKMQTLNEATIAALAVDPDFDLQAALQQHFLNATFTAVA